MKKRIVVTFAMLAIIACGVTGCKKESEQPATPDTTVAPTAPVAPAPMDQQAVTTGMTGEQLFKQHCSTCHAEGRNTVTPAKDLSAKGLAQRSNITTPEDIVRVMRGPNHNFAVGVISDEDARKIGEYVLATFP